MLDSLCIAVEFLSDVIWLFLLNSFENIMINEFLFRSFLYYSIILFDFVSDNNALFTS